MSTGNDFCFVSPQRLTVLFYQLLLAGGCWWIFDAGCHTAWTARATVREPSTATPGDE